MSQTFCFLIGGFALPGTSKENSPRAGVVHAADSYMGRTPPKVLTIATQC